MLRVALVSICFALTCGAVFGFRAIWLLHEFQKDRWMTEQLLDRRKYRLASISADSALKLKREVGASADINNDMFVDSLMALGRYEDAKELLRTIPAGSSYYMANFNIIEGFRRRSLVNAFVGLHDHRRAILAASLSNRYERDPDIRQLIDQSAAKAFLAAGDVKSAQNLLAEAGLNGESPLDKQYRNLINLRSRDERQAQEVADQAISFWSQSDWECIEELEFTEQILSQRQCPLAAKLVRDEVSRIKQL